MAHIFGYARVSTGDQMSRGQTLRLAHAGAIKVFHRCQIGKEHGPATPRRPSRLCPSWRHARYIVHLDRLGRSPAELLATVTMLRERQIALLRVGFETYDARANRRMSTMAEAA